MCYHFAVLYHLRLFRAVLFTGIQWIHLNCMRKSHRQENQYYVPTSSLLLQGTEWTANNVRGRSKTTLTRFCLFRPPTPLRWHFLWYKRWQKVDIFGPPNYHGVYLCLIFEMSIWEFITNSKKKSIWKQTRFFVEFELDFYCLCSLQKSSSNSKKNRVSKSIFFSSL